MQPPCAHTQELAAAAAVSKVPPSKQPGAGAKAKGGPPSGKGSMSLTQAWSKAPAPKKVGARTAPPWRLSTEVLAHKRAGVRGAQHRGGSTEVLAHKRAGVRGAQHRGGSTEVLA